MALWNSPRSAATAVALAALSGSLVLTSFHLVGYFGVETDFFGAYAVQAQRLLEGKTYTSLHNPPGYTCLLALLSLFTGDMFAAGKLLSALATAMLVWISFDLFRRLFSVTVALAASSLLTLMLLPHSYLAATDVLGALLALLPMWVVLRARSGNKSSWLLAGLLAALAYLVRANAIFVIAALLLFGAFVEPRGQPAKRRYALLGLLLCSFLLGVSPWLVANWHLNGHPLASSAHLQVAAHFFHPRGDSYGTSLWEMGPSFRSLGEVLLFDPPRLIRAYSLGLWHNLQRLTTESLFFPAYLFAGAGALIYCAGIDRRKAALLLWGLLGFLLLGLVGFYARYYLFLYPILALWVVLPFFTVGNRLFGSDRHAAGAHSASASIGLALLSLLLCLSAFQSFRRVVMDLKSEPRHVLVVASELARRATPDTLMITRKPHVAYFAGVKKFFPLAHSAAEFREAADEAGATYLLYSDFEARLWPPLAEFRDEDGVAPYGFQAVYHHAPTNTMLYRIEHPWRAAIPAPRN